MRTVSLTINIPGRSPDEVFATLSDFARYPELSSAVRSVTVSKVGGDVTVSSWEVAFRAGILRWVEQDTFDRSARSITFRQLDGDVALFDGSWRCARSTHGTTISFDARLDMGIPSLADALEPIAARTLVENTLSIVRGLFGEQTLLMTSHVGVPEPVGSAS